MQRPLLAFALVCTAVLFACPKPSPSGGPDDGSTPPDGVADPSAGDGGTQSSPTSCLSDADCSGGVCEGQGCGDDQPGTCAPTDRICSRDSQAYCGCDGQTFRASGSCPGRRYASKGECEAPSDGGGTEAGALADGSPCHTGAECQSGICEGEGCSDNQLGQCMPTARPCTRDYKPYCGCDGQTFHGSGSCPGQRFDHRGEC